jgi:DNA-binding transcriptional regulator GbsR (MarR family)
MQIADGRSTVQEDQRRLEEKHFIEDCGLFFEQWGLPRMAGRILGWLLISDPPYQSPSDMAQSLQASKGSISTMTRLLMQEGLIEQVGLPGERRDFFRIKEGAWTRLMSQRLAVVSAIHQLAERGFALLEKEPAGCRQRLDDFHDLYAFIERELPALLGRWEVERKVHKPVPPPKPTET